MAGPSLSQSPTVVRLGVEPSDVDEGLSIFAEVRPRLLGIAYRILGSVADVEDIVQDVWIRWQLTNRRAVATPAAFLATTTARLCINILQSAQSRHETRFASSLPEPVDTTRSPVALAERYEAVKVAVLILLEKLTPTERGAYVLREAFDCPYSKIASILQIEEAHTRQLISRARKHLAGCRHFAVNQSTLRRLLEAFLVATQYGDTSALEKVLVEDVPSSSNIGGTIRSVKPKILIMNPSRISSPPFPYFSEGRETSFGKHRRANVHACVA